MSDNSDISEAGFDEDVLDSAVQDDISKANSNDEPDKKVDVPVKKPIITKKAEASESHEPLGTTTGGNKKVGIIAVVAAVLCIPIIWAVFSLNQKSVDSGFDLPLVAGNSDDAIPLFESTLVAPEPELTSGAESNTTALNSSAAESNSIGSEVALQERVRLSEPNTDGSIVQLLSNYPTKAELEGKISELKGADVSDAELDVFLLTVSRNAEDIKALFANENSEDLKSMVQDLLSQLEQEKAKTALLENSISDHKKTLSDFKKNQGWFINRLNKLEGKTQAVSSKPPRSTKTRSLSVVTVRDHAIKGIADKVVYLKINNRGKPVRATVGFDIPGCGPITSIEAIKRHVITSSCIIK